MMKRDGTRMPKWCSCIVSFYRQYNYIKPDDSQRLLSNLMTHGLAISNYNILRWLNECVYERLKIVAVNRN